MATNQEINIQYLPDIFPTVTFNDTIVVESEIQVLPPRMTIAKTEKKWSTIYDKIKTERKIQSMLEERRKLKLVTIEDIGYPLIELAEETYIVTSNNETIYIYDVNVNYTLSDIPMRWIVEIEYSIKNPNQLVTYLSSDVCENLALKNSLQVDIN